MSVQDETSHHQPWHKMHEFFQDETNDRDAVRVQKSLSVVQIVVREPQGGSEGPKVGFCSTDCSTGATGMQ